MSATRCTCIRDERFLRLVADPTCPAEPIHLRFPTERHAGVPSADAIAAGEPARRPGPTSRT
jgi:hypothetical protein